MDEILHRIEAMGKHCLLAFTGESPLNGFLGQEDFVHPQYYRTSKIWSASNFLLCFEARRSCLCARGRGLAPSWHRLGPQSGGFQVGRGEANWLPNAGGGFCPLHQVYNHLTYIYIYIYKYIYMYPPPMNYLSFFLHKLTEQNTVLIYIYMCVCRLKKHMSV